MSTGGYTLCLTLIKSNFKRYLNNQSTGPSGRNFSVRL